MAAANVAELLDIRKTVANCSTESLRHACYNAHEFINRETPSTSLYINLGIVSPMANVEATAEDFIDQVLERCDQTGFQSIKVFRDHRPRKPRPDSASQKS